MSRMVDKAQLTIFGTDARRRVRDRLLSWPDLDKKAQRLQRLIEQDREALRHLDDQIHSYMIPKYETMDMPGGQGVSDKVGDLVARLVDKRDELHLSIMENELRLHDLKRDLNVIEMAVNELNPFHAEIVRRYYFQKERWESTCIQMRIQKSRFYEVLAEVLDVLGDQL
ncbi:MAG: hypothetical protein M0Z65_10810 [Firmicutes bacterium]|uniref:DUF1492 domain-containing protein n=1 Tax=Kroppenstedtia guangzhouensis TaxID=1274356 RepID=A0ABQ1GMX7_9BACL|nr:hypothetical protein [Kroppenstedtia guangzhouensis]MDA8353648.1 hypothetical protein [Bacillota bacterium]GGA47031.1 hypothetical protein GCM10007416_20270 [Kroppenstedtia guangzhouensis]